MHVVNAYTESSCEFTIAGIQIILIEEKKNVIPIEKEERIGERTRVGAKIKVHFSTAFNFGHMFIGISSRWKDSNLCSNINKDPKR